MKTRKKKIKNQRSLQQKKGISSTKETRGQKIKLSYQKKSLTKNKSKVFMMSSPPPLNVMGYPMSGGRPMKKTQKKRQSASDNIADDIVFAFESASKAGENLRKGVQEVEAAEAKKAQEIASLKKQQIDNLGINWWDNYFIPQIDYSKIFDSVYYLSFLNVLDKLNFIKEELGQKYTLLMDLKNYIPEIEKNKTFLSNKKEDGFRNCEDTYFFTFAEENQKLWKENQKKEIKLPNGTSQKRQFFDIKEDSFKKKFESYKNIAGSSNPTHEEHQYFIQYYLLRNTWGTFYQLSNNLLIEKAFLKNKNMKEPSYTNAVSEIKSILKGKDLSLFPLKRFDKYWRLICLLSNNKLDTQNTFYKIKKDIYNYQIFGDNPEKKKELDVFFKDLDLKTAKQKREQIQKKKVPILNETVEYHNNNLDVALIISLGVNYHVKEKKKAIENILNGTQSMGLSLMTKLNDCIEDIIKTVKEKLPGVKNVDLLKEKLLKFTEDINGPSDIFRKMKELPKLFDDDKSDDKSEDKTKEKDCVDNCSQFLTGLKKIDEKNWKKTYKKLSLKFHPDKNIKESPEIRKENEDKFKNLNECNQQFDIKKKFCLEEDENTDPKSNVEKTETSQSLALTEDQKIKITEIIKNKFKSLMTSMMGPKISDDVARHLKKLNPLDSLKDLIRTAVAVVDGFRDSARTKLGVQFVIDDDFIIENQQKLEICKCLKKHSVRVDHGLLSYIHRNKGDIQGKIKDITYDFKVGQIKFDDSNVYWIPLELGKKKDTQILSGGTKKNFQRKNSKNSLKRKNKKIIFGGYETMWQILLPIYDLDNCRIPPESNGPKRSKPPPLNVRGKAGGGDSSSKKKKRFSFPKLKNPFAKKKEEEMVVKDIFPEQKLKFSGSSMRNTAKVAITVFISLVKSMENNSHFKFIYYFAINSIYKFIKSIKEILKYSKTANKNKKAARYLVYLGKLVCINTSNLFNVDLLDYVNDKLNLALEFYQLDALKNISQLLKLGIQKIFDFNNQFCQYTAQLEMKLSSDNTSEKEQSGETNENEEKEDEQTPSLEYENEEEPKEN